MPRRAPGPRIMITYRREDSAGWATSVHERLSARFGPDRVFMDVDNIRLGEDFTEAIARAIDDCDVMIALIGRHWVAAVDAAGNRRLFAEHDYVRVEVLAALERGIPLIPVLIDGASMPVETDLPAEIGGIARRQAYDLDVKSFQRDIDHLVADLERWVPPQHRATQRDRPSERDAEDAPSGAEERHEWWQKGGSRAGALVALAVIVTAVVVLWPHGKTASLRLVATIAVGKEPQGIAFTPGGVWVSSHAGHTVERIDPAANRVVSTVTLDGPVGDVIYAFGSLWVASENNAVYRVLLPSEHAEKVALAFGAVDLAADNRYVWVSGVGGGVGHIDPGTGAFATTANSPSGTALADIDTYQAMPAACPGETVWVSDTGGNAINELDGAGALRRHITTGIGRAPIGLATGFGSVWVTNSGDGTLTRLDACDATPRTVSLGAGTKPWGVAVGPHDVWVANAGDASLVRIDPKRNAAVASIALGAYLDPVAVDGRGDVWVGGTESGLVYRVKVRN